MFCTKCGKEAPAGRVFCMNCGAPLAGAPPETGTQTDEGEPPSFFSQRRVRYLIIALAVLVIAAAATAAGVLIAGSHGGGEDDGSGGGVTVTSVTGTGSSDASTTTAAPAVVATATTAAPATTAPTSTSSTTTSSTTTTTLSPADADDWPEIDAYTVIVANFSADDPSGEDQAAAFRDDMLADGFDAGIIYSSGYSSLKPGWWAVFSGFFATASDARVHMQWCIDNGFPLAYAREVTR